MWQKMIENSLSEFINNLITSMLTLETNPYTVAGIIDKYNISIIIGYTLLGITLAYAVVGYKFSMDIFDVGKIKKIFQDLLVAGFLMNFSFFLIGKAGELANIIAEGWYGSHDIGNVLMSYIIQSIGIGAIGTVISPVIGIGVLLVLGVIILLLGALALTNIILGGMTSVLLIILPVLLGFYPLKLGKQFLQKWLSLLIGVISISHVQALAISLFFTSTATAELGFGSAMECLGKLIIVVLIVPGAMFYMFSVAGNANIVN